METQNFDVIVIGAGPTGSWTAREFARSGFKTALLEEHAEVGLPVHCTGIVGEDIFERFPSIRSCIWSSAERFQVFSPEGHSLLLPNVKAYVLNRRRLDLHLAEMAVSEGATLLLNHKASAITQMENSVTVSASAQGQEVLYEGKIAILATGSTSHLPRRSTLSEPPQFIRGVQVEVEIENLSNVELYLGGEIAPGSFAWAVPTHGSFAKVGLITLGNARIYLDKLFASSFLRHRIKGTAGKPMVSRIPLGAAPVSANHRVLAVGDAAGQVKTTTGGGIYYGLLGAEELISTALPAYKNGNFVPSSLLKYPKRWQKKLGLELHAGLYVRRVFQKVEDADINRLIRLFKRQELLQLVERHANFDRHRDLIFALTRVPDFRAIMVDLVKRNFSFRNFFSGLSGAQ